MAETENLVLEHVRHIRGPLDSLEAGLAEHSLRLQRLDARVTQIQKRA